ncbi:MAG: HipA domain-containing protein [Clostridia bacterium]|nr:HipA domain-containing protein [Clostridia bacterium]
MDLAKLFKLNVPETKLEKLSKFGNTFLTKRFDRKLENGNVRRIHMTSMMSLLGKMDNEKASYLDIVSFIKENSSDPKTDLLELYKRLLFNIAISNSDDHLRNHACIISNNS